MIELKYSIIPPLFYLTLQSPSETILMLSLQYDHRKFFFHMVSTLSHIFYAVINGVYSH